MIGEVKKSGGGSADVVNGIIEQYKASTSTIDANTFVEFVNNTNMGTDTTIVAPTTDAPAPYNNARATQIDTNKVFVAYDTSSPSSGISAVTKGVGGVVCTINNSTITVGEKTILHSYSSINTYKIFDVIKLDTDKVFVLYGGIKTTSALLGIVCTISGLTITKGTFVAIVTYGSSSTNMNAAAVALSSTKVFVSHRTYNSNYTLSGTVCTVSGTTISTGSATSLGPSAGSTSSTPSSVSLIDTNKVFVAHRYGDNLNGLVCTVSGTTISTGSDTQLAATYYANLKVVTLETNKVVVLHSSDSTNKYTNSIICNVSDTTITPDTDTTIILGTDSVSYMDSILLEADTLFITYKNSSNYYLMGVICKISSGTIVVGTGSILVSSTETAVTVSVSLIDNNKLFISHRFGNNLNGIVGSIISVIQESTTKIDGLTKTECTTSTAGDVWVLDV